MASGEHVKFDGCRQWVYLFSFIFFLVVRINMHRNDRRSSYRSRSESKDGSGCAAAVLYTYR